ncbi:30S ribosomal protein S16 [bacterium]|nr:30S ribosomal protein S16 [bacterium]
MSVKMRLTRKGSKKRPVYRVVVADSRAPRDGRYIDVVGFYDPKTNPKTIRFKEDLVKQHLGNGVIPSETVRMLLKKTGLV